MEQAAWRILDANANRAAEGLRTLEDFARLAREDAMAAEWVKNLRHRLGSCVQNLSRSERLQSRSTESDAGTEISTSTEAYRGTVDSVVTPAVERVTQSLRQLEEFSKIVMPAVSEDFKQLRYDAYDILAKLEQRLIAGQNLFEHSHLYVLIDCGKPESEFVDYISALSEAGVDWFQLRDKSAEVETLMKYARLAADAMRMASTSHISHLAVNDRVDVALSTPCQAVHVGQEDLSLEDTRALTGVRRSIGMSTHSLEQAIEAEQGGADYIGCGPTFPSNTKQFSAFAGVDFLRAVAERIQIPAFAIGGIDLDNVAQVIEAGCRRIAVSGVVHSADDPVQITRQLKEILAGD